MLVRHLIFATKFYKMNGMLIFCEKNVSHSCSYFRESKQRRWVIAYIYNKVVVYRFIYGKCKHNLVHIIDFPSEWPHLVMAICT